MFKVPNQYRVLVGRGASRPTDGNNGVFFIPVKRKVLGFMRESMYAQLQCIASDGLGWEHVSVCLVSNDRKKLVERTPTWEEMCIVKNHFWEPEDTCIQFHPDEENYVNKAKFVLHIWRRIGSYYEVPEILLV